MGLTFQWNTTALTYWFSTLYTFRQQSSRHHIKDSDIPGCHLTPEAASRLLVCSGLDKPL